MGSRVLAGQRESPPVDLMVVSQIEFADVLPWLRAFHSGVADNLAVTGAADLQVAIADWPPRIRSASVSSAGLQLLAPNLPHPAHLGEFRFRWDGGIVSLPPVAMSFASPDDSVHFESAPKPGPVPSNSSRISASVIDVHDILASASALGWNLAKGWDIAGPVRADLRWQGSGYPWEATAVGFIDWGAGPGAVKLSAPFLNHPVAGINAVSEWKPGSRHIALASAEAFGARWSGSIDRIDAAPGWHFSLAADHLSAADIDRWLNPVWRQSFLGRVLPFLNSRSALTAAPENLRASGRLAVDQFTLLPFVVRKLQGDLRIDGRHITFDNAAGQFYGGQLNGSLDANFLAVPTYRAEVSFSRIDAAALAAATPLLAGLTAESAAGEISLLARGANHADLMASLTCQGSAAATAPQLLHVAMPKFVSADSSFSCWQRKIEFQSLSLSTGLGQSAIGSGAIDFNRTLDLGFRFRSRGDEEGTSDRSFRLTGALAAPKWTASDAAPRRSR